jgi:hypothetical protein
MHRIFSFDRAHQSIARGYALKEDDASRLIFDRSKFPLYRVDEAPQEKVSKKLFETTHTTYGAPKYSLTD